MKIKTFSILTLFVLLGLTTPVMQLFAQSGKSSELYTYEVRVVYSNYMGQRTITVKAKDESEARQKGIEEFNRQRPGQIINSVSVKYVPNN